VLIGRRAPPPATSAVIDQMRARGTDVVTEAVDVTGEAALGDLLTRLRASGPPLRGVFHCAAVIDDAGLLQQDQGGLLRVLAPKVRGGWLLDRLTRTDPLDCFVMFSSVAGALGSAGQANYAAANAVLDQLAQERRNRGLCGLSIGWGAWAGTGMAAERGLRERLAASGLDALTPQEGIAALERLLQASATRVSVLRMDWQRYAARTTAARRRFLADILGAGHHAGTATSAPPLPPALPAEDLRRQITDAPRPRRRAMVSRFVSDCALRILGMDPGKQLDPLMPLGELGLDSLLAVEMRNALSAAIGQMLPATLLFDHPTIEAITGHFASEILQLGDAGPQPAHEPEPAAELDLVGAVEGISDEDVDRLLASRMGDSA
jgi:hypothetical protein